MGYLDLMFLGENLDISKVLIKYIVEFIHVNLFIKKNIVINSKYYLVIGFHLYKKGNFGPTGVYIPFKKRKTGNGISTSIALPIEEITASINPQLKLIQLIYEGFTLYFIENYKTVSRGDMEKLFEEMNFDFISAIPFPAYSDDKVMFYKLISEQL